MLFFLTVILCIKTSLEFATFIAYFVTVSGNKLKHYTLESFKLTKFIYLAKFYALLILFYIV